jgi:AAA domain
MVRDMLLWINGPFGGGKTQTAHEIQRRLAGSVVCDPEHVGIGLHRMTPRELRGNYQDIPAWRQGTRQVLGLVLGRQHGDVIVPMTVIEPAYLEEILGPLRADGRQVRHCSLLADRATVLRRLRGRNLPLQHDAFAEAMLDRCLDRLSRDDFADHIRTDGFSIAEVADRVAASAGLTLAPDGDSFLRARARQTWVTIKHIRIA